MKRIIMIEQVFAFINKAMAENLKVEFSNGTISVYNLKKDEWCDFKVSSNTLTVSNRMGNNIIEIDESEYHKFQVLCDVVNEYSQDKSVEVFLNFFKEDESRPTDINDLDED